MRRLLIAALLLAGLVAPPAVLAQIGSPPGISVPPASTISPTFTGTALFGSGTCAGTSTVPFTGGIPGIAFSTDTDSGLCWDTAGGVAGSVGPAFMKDGRQVLRLNRAGGVLFAHNTGGTLKTRAATWDLSGVQFYGWDATGGAERSLGGFSYDDAATPTKGALTLGANTGLAFQGTTLDATLTYITVTNPTGVRSFNLPDFSGTALVSVTANEPDTGNAVWANTGSFLFEGPTANGFETELDVVEPTADRLIYLPNLSGTLLVGNTTNTVSSLGVYSTSTITLNSDGRQTFSANAGVDLPAWTDIPTTITDDASSQQYTTFHAPDTPGAYPVRMVITDTTPSLAGGNFHICGVTVRNSPYIDRVSCETVPITVAGTYNSVSSYYSLTSVKSTSVTVLGGGGDETVVITLFGDTGTVYSGNLVTHTKNVATTLSAGFSGGVGEIYCADLELGCDLTLDSSLGYDMASRAEWVIGATSGEIRMVEGTEMELAGPYTMSPGQSISLVFNDTLDKWVETSRSTQVNGFRFEGTTADSYQTDLGATDPTADRTVTIPDADGIVHLQSRQIVSVPDSGGPGAATATLAVNKGVSLVELSCLDADGCDITMGEASPQGGHFSTIVNMSANACNFADTAGLSELTGAITLGQYDSLTLIYATDRWVQVTTSNN